MLNPSTIQFLIRKFTYTNVYRVQNIMKNDSFKHLSVLNIQAKIKHEKPSTFFCILL